MVQCWKFFHPHLPPICNAYRTRCRFQCQSNYAANETIKPPGRSFKRAHPFRQPGSIATDPLRQPDAAATNTMRCDEKSIEILFYVIGLRNWQRQRHNKMSASPPSSILTMVKLLEEGGYCTVVGVISVPVFKWQPWRPGSIMNFIMLGPVTGNAFCYYCAGSIYEIFSIAVMPMLPPAPCPLSSLLAFLSRLRNNPQNHLQNSDACVPNEGCLPPNAQPPALCVAECQSLAARRLGSLLRLTPTSAVQFCSVKRARFRLGSFLAWPSILCKNLFSKRLSVAKKLCRPKKYSK